jgi:RNA polymerase sigma factor (sigma-70 family)
VDAGLLFARLFAWIENVPVDEDQASGNGIAPRTPPRIRPMADTQNGAAAFTTTHWSVLLAAQGPSPAAEEALEKLCRTYWRPIYGFVRRQGVGPEEAKDLTQGFFALLLERRDLDTVRKEKGRLRSYLLTSLKHFLTNERSRAMAIKRGEGQRLIPLEDLREHEGVGFQLSDPLTADQIYERRWALSLLDQVLTRLGDEYRAAGPTAAGLFDQLQKLLTDESDRPSQADTAHELGMTENAVKQAFHRLRQRYRELLREEIAHTVMLPGDIEDELRHLIAVLRA